jgi:hypothetical protein
MKRLAVLASVASLSVGACSPGSDSLGPNFEALGPYVEAAPPLKDVIDESTVQAEVDLEDHLITVSRSEGAKYPLGPEDIAYVGRILLSSVSSDGDYEGFAVDEQQRVIEDSRVSVSTAELDKRRHFVFVARQSQAFEELATLTSVGAIKNAYTFYNFGSDLPTVSLINESVFVGSKEYFHLSGVKAYPGGAITELCQSLIKAEPKLAGLSPQEHALLGNELYCNSVARAIAFALAGKPYEDYAKDIAVSPLEVAKNSFGVNIPYLRVPVETYEKLAKRDMDVTLGFVAPELNSGD